MTAEAALRGALSEGYRRLCTMGLNSGSSGNLSARLADGLLITATGATEATATPESIVSIGLDGIVRGAGTPSSEWAMHAAIYRRHPAASAIVHSHADACVALSCLRRPIPPFHYMVASFGGDDVPCAPYHTFGTPLLAEAAALAITGRTACLLGSHGMICHGASVAAAIETAIRLESVARHYLLALSAGGPVLLTADELAEAHARFRTYGRAAGSDAAPPAATGRTDGGPRAGEH